MTVLTASEDASHEFLDAKIDVCVDVMEFYVDWLQKDEDCHVPGLLSWSY